MSRLVIKNIARNPFRTGALILSFAFIAASLFAGQYLIAGATENMKSALSHVGADAMVVPGQDFSQSFDMILRGTPATFFFDTITTDAIAKVDGVGQVAPQIYLVTLGADCCSAPVQLIAINPGDSITRRWLRDTGQKPPGKDEILVGSGIDGSVGDNLTFYGHTFIIAGRLEPTGTGTDVSVFLRREDAYAMAADSAKNAAETLVIPDGKVSAILVQVSNDSTVDTVALAITNQVPGTMVITPRQLAEKVSDQLAPVTQMLALAAILTILVSFPLITLVSVMATEERRNEFKTLRMQGASRGNIFAIIMGESLVIAATGGCIGVGIASLILVLYQGLLSVTTQVTIAMPAPVPFLSGALFALLVTAAIGGTASLYPAYMHATRDP